MTASTIEPQTFSYVEGSTDPEQQLDLYLPSPTSSPSSSLIIFIHGGAWRTGSRKDHADLAQFLCSKGKAVAVVDYRLSVKDESTGLPKVIHPVHGEDVNAALAFLAGRQDVPKKDWMVVGHSIGAWLTLASIIDGAPRQGNSQYPQPVPVPNSDARDLIKTCVLVDGIYSVSKLLKEYPDYEGFVAQAFLPQPGPANYDVVSSETWPLALNGNHLHVWHSRDDELLSFRQSIDAILHLDEQLATNKQDASEETGAKTVEIPDDGVASETNVDGQKKSIASVYGPLKIKNHHRLHVDLTTLRVRMNRTMTMKSGRENVADIVELSHFVDLQWVLQGAHDDLLHTETFWNLVLKL